MGAMAKETVLKGATLALAATGSLALTWGATPAMAQGKGFVPMSDPFNSFSLGIGGGVDIFRTSTDSYLSPPGLDFGGPLRGVGGFATIEVGKDFRFDRLVFGIAAEYNFGRKSDDVSGTYCSDGCATGTAELELRDSHAVMARLGLLTGPQTLFYGLFGYTWQKYTATATEDATDCCSYVDSTSRSGMIGGLTFGVGGEWLINSQWSLKGEYRFVRLNAPREFVGAGCCTYAFFDDKVDDHVFRGALSFKLPSP